MSDTKNLKSLGGGTSGFKTWQAVIKKFKELNVCQEALDILIERTTSQPKLLETFDNQHLDNLHLIPFIQPNIEFTSLCPLTGQPDFAALEIIYVPNEKMIESKSLKLYITSYRNEGSFHEDVCNKIANDLFNLLQPKYLRVYGDFVSRGSLAIKPMVEKWDADSVDSYGNEDLERFSIRALVNQYDLKVKK